MKRKIPFAGEVVISSNDSSCSVVADDEGCGSNRLKNYGAIIHKPTHELISEDAGAVIRRAQMYQEYMKQIPIPTNRASIIPCTSWTGLAKSIKQLYGQPLHYLTNIYA